MSPRVVVSTRVRDSQLADWENEEECVSCNIGHERDCEWTFGCCAASEIKILVECILHYIPDLDESQAYMGYLQEPRESPAAPPRAVFSHSQPTLVISDIDF